MGADRGQIVEGLGRTSAAHRAATNAQVGHHAVVKLRRADLGGIVVGAELYAAVIDSVELDHHGGWEIDHVEGVDVGLRQVPGLDLRRQLSGNVGVGQE